MRLTRDLLSGLMFCAFGVGAAVVARDYNFGSLNRMGSGFFPIVIGLGIAILGSIITARALLKPESSEPIAAIEFRPVFSVGLAIVVFGFLIEDWGLIAALIALIVIARFAGYEGGPIEVAVMVVVLSAIAIAIFVYALNIRLYLWPEWVAFPMKLWPF
jgi:hypothetical protein